jgi:hypothetical protein
VSPRLSTLLCVVIVAAAAGVSVWPLFTHEALPRGSDVSWHAQWVSGFLDGLRDGHLYPRWISEANRGFGAPVFVFYPPIPYWVAGGLGLAGLGLLDIFRFAFLLASLASGLLFYAAARPVTSRAGATLGAVLYVLLPYHMLDLYDRFAYAEVVAFVWLPPIFHFTRRLAVGEGGAGSAAGLAASTAALIMTHLPAAFMAPFAAGPYALFLVARRRSWRRLAPMAAAAAGALALAAVFVLPWLVEGQAVNLDWRMTGQWNGDWRVNFVYEHPPGARPDPIKPLVASSVSTQLLLGAAAALVLFARGRRVPPLREEGVIWAALAAWTFLLQVSISKPIWALVPVLGDIQFPWRFGTLQVLATAFLCALALAPLPAPVEKKKKRKEAEPPPSWLARPVIAGALVAAAALPALRASAQVTSKRPYAFDERLAATPAYAQRMTYEYIARGVEDYARFERVKVDDARAWIRGPGTVSALEWRAQRRRVTVDARGPVTLRLRTFDHPGWRARLDGAPAAIASDNPLRAIEVAVPEGRHEVEVELGPTWDRTAGAWISGAALLALLGAGGLGLRRRPG